MQEMSVPVLPSEQTPMEFRILGPLEVEDLGVLVPVGCGRQRALLAILLLHANEVACRIG